MQLAADMQRFSRPERRINGPTTTHLWCVWAIFIIFQILFWTYHWIYDVMDNFTIIFIFTILELHHAWSHLISLRLWFFLSGQCWSYLMFWFNSIILKMPRRAYLMIFPGIKGMGITNLHWCASSLFIQCVRRLSVSWTVNHCSLGCLLSLSNDRKSHTVKICKLP